MTLFTRSQRYDYSVLASASALVEATAPSPEAHELRQWLAWRIELGWNPSKDSATTHYDAMVKNLAREALSVYRKRHVPGFVALLVTGSRSLALDKGLTHKARQLIIRALSRLPAQTLVVHGGAEGPDSWAQATAQLQHLETRTWLPGGGLLRTTDRTLTLSEPRWAPRGTSPGPLKRNEAMVKELKRLQDEHGYSSWVLALVDPNSQTKGTMHTVNLALNAGLTVLREDIRLCHYTEPSSRVHSSKSCSIAFLVQPAGVSSTTRGTWTCAVGSSTCLCNSPRCCCSGSPGISPGPRRVPCSSTRWRSTIFATSRRVSVSWSSPT